MSKGNSKLSEREFECSNVRPECSSSSTPPPDSGPSHDTSVLDVTSADFDPLRALYSDIGIKDTPQTLNFDNVAQCESFFKRKDAREKKSEEKRFEEAKISSGLSTQIKEESLKPGEGRLAPLLAPPQRQYSKILKDPTSSGLIPTKPKRALRNVMTRMDEYEEGPLSLLRRAVKDGHRIRVWTRSHVYIRGICSGFLVAYDKHFNLAMTDVDEDFMIPKTTRDAVHRRMKKRRARLKRKVEWAGVQEQAGIKNETDEPSSCAPQEWRPTSETHFEHPEESEEPQIANKFGQVQKRHIGQLFIKGDNVVMVSLV